MSLLSSSVCPTDEMKIKNECLHQENNSGDTLLKLIMSHGDKMSVHREILIEAEREYHRRSSSIEGISSRLSLAECFKNNIGETWAWNYVVQWVLKYQVIYCLKNKFFMQLKAGGYKNFSHKRFSTQV